MKRITVFGGAKPTPGEPAYEEALHLGRLLGAEGYTVLTGGYIGTMEAVSRGAAESGGRVVGVTCQEIETWRSIRPNKWVQEEMRFDTLRQRLFCLMEECDAALALPGGPGTLAEIAITWNHLLTGLISPRPLIMIGAGWRSTFDAYYRSLGEYVPEPHRGYLSFVPDVDAAFQHLQVALRVA